VPDGDDQGTQYAAFIEAQLKAENDRRDSVNTRAASVLTGSAGLVTLVLAVFAVFIGKDFTLKGSQKTYLAAALLFLLGAAILALIAQIPWASKGPLPTLLASFLDVPDPSKGRPWGWSNTEVDAREWTAKCNLRTLGYLRRGTQVKLFILLLAGLLQVLAVIFLVFCVCSVVDAQPDQNPKPTPAPCCLTSSCPTTTSPGPSKP
jgi:hypothetical protein